LIDARIQRFNVLNAPQRIVDAEWLPRGIYSTLEHSRMEQGAV